MVIYIDIDKIKFRALKPLVQYILYESIINLYQIRNRTLCCSMFSNHIISTNCKNHQMKNYEINFYNNLYTWMEYSRLNRNVNNTHLTRFCYAFRPKESLLYEVWSTVINKPLDTITVTQGVLECFISMLIWTTFGITSSTPRPTLEDKSGDKDKIYEDLQRVFCQIPKIKEVFVITNFCVTTWLDRSTWTPNFWHYVIVKINSNS